MIGIGDVFLGIGQSNMSGRGDNNQSYSHASLQAILLDNSYRWREMTDPTDAPPNTDAVSLDSLAAGSYIPLIATAFMADQGVPFAYIPAALKATYWSQWTPTFDHYDRTKLYGSAAYRASLQANGIKCVLCHLGEGDSGVAETTQAGLNALIDQVANAFMTDIGAPTMICKIQNNGGVALATVNAAIGEAWADNPNVLEGPDFSDLELSPDANHFTTDAHLQTAADRWWAALQAAFYS